MFFHSDVELLKPGAMLLGKSARPDLVESSFHGLRDVLGSKRQESACSPTMNSTLSVDAEMARRVTSRTQDEEDCEVYEEIIQLHNSTRESRHHS